MSSLQNVLMIALMVFGFGFVVFFHELGHFLAAKWVGIKVEQFAVGFGQALFAWRKGIGWRVGTTTPEYNKRIEQHLAAKAPADSKDKEKAEYTDEQMSAAALELGLGDTEYRLNWMPLGGYVKMLGQDDLKPGVDVADPRAYNRKSVGQRMIVVSAGVIMNIILAAIFFMIIFRVGFNVPPAVVGNVLPGSPAQKAGLLPGDRTLMMDGKRIHTFANILLNTALLPDGVAVPLDYTRPGVPGVQHTMIQAQRNEDDKKASTSIGMSAASQLTVLYRKDVTPAEFDKLKDPAAFLPDTSLIRPGDVITAIAGKPVPSIKDSYLLDEAFQASNGEPIELTVKRADGKIETVKVKPYFESVFMQNKAISFAGMETLPELQQFAMENSPAKGKLKPGDVVTAITLNDLKRFPSLSDLKDRAGKAYDEGKKLTIDVLRLQPDGTYTPVKVENVEAAMKTGNGHHGLGVGLSSADRVPIVSTVEENSPAKKAGIPSGARIIEVDGEKVSNWFQIRTLLQKSVGDHKIVAEIPEVKDPVTYTLTLASGDVDWLKNLRITHILSLRELREPRQTNSLATAAGWGVTETRDFILQFYVTLKRMWQGSVGLNNMMGPIGMVSAGAHIASKGMDWLLWFLAMISANLAVVNFLPIPIVDGGLFTFLIIEKIQGKPVSQKVQAVAQLVGFALIISVFLLVTYNDIKRAMGLG